MTTAPSPAAKTRVGFTLGTASLKELDGVHPDLVRVVKRAIQITTQDFSVHDGLRTEAEQRRYVATGVSKTMNSMHRTQVDGYGHAVDLVPFIGGKLRWEWPAAYPIATAMRIAAEEQGAALIWGGVWDKPLRSIPANPQDMNRAVQLYGDRRRKAGKSVFVDAPHFELAK
jgi:peptidoglycan L-alanyl-D-glutamate endopeptidase CwlK